MNPAQLDYEDELDEGRYVDPVDPLSAAIAGQGYVARYRPDGCVERVAECEKEPEEFVRFYFLPPVEGYDGPAPLLVDLLMTGSETEQAAESVRKNVEFKRRWCAENDMRYVVLVDDALVSVYETRKLIADQLGEEPKAARPKSRVTTAPKKGAAPKRRPARKPQGAKVQRPGQG